MSSQKGIARPQSQYPHSCVCERFRNIFPGSVCLFWCRKICGPIVEYINRSQTHKAARFHFWEYLFRIFSIVSLQCRKLYYNSTCQILKRSLVCMPWQSLFSLFFTIWNPSPEIERVLSTQDSTNRFQFWDSFVRAWSKKTLPITIVIRGLVAYSMLVKPCSVDI